MRVSLRELLPQLDPQRFWQVHRGHIVHVDAIDRIRRKPAAQTTNVVPPWSRICNSLPECDVIRMRWS